MSFDEGSRLESQDERYGEEYTDDEEFSRFSKEISDGLLTLTSNIATSSRLVALLGTKRDKPEIRERIKSLTDETREQCKEVGARVKRLQQWGDVSPSGRFTQQKLSREFSSALTDFQAVQRLSAEKSRAFIQVGKAALHETDDVGGTEGDEGEQHSELLQQQIHQQQQLADQGEVDFTDALIQEREQDIQGIEQGINELNEIFRDLGTIVTEQGVLVDNIESNISNVHDHTRGAATELTKASRYQRSSRNRMCCLLVILAIIVTIVILAIVLG